jgi:hypothetical protein
MTFATDTAATETEAKARFVHDTADHRLTVLHDDGLYKHLRFAKPGTGMYHYDLITWPGHLTYAGDMGTFTFRREEDMLGFFRHKRRDYINPHYWSEKLLDRGRELGKAYSEDAYRRQVTDALDDWIEAYYENEAQASSLRAAVQDDLLDTSSYFYPGTHYQSATEAIHNFRHRMVAVDAQYEFDAAEVLESGSREQLFTFEDSWEWDLTGYDLFFLWACYAIQHGIHEYDAHQEQAVREQQKEKAAAYA